MELDVMAMTKFVFGIDCICAVMETSILAHELSQLHPGSPLIALATRVRVSVCVCVCVIVNFRLKIDNAL